MHKSEAAIEELKNWGRWLRDDDGPQIGYPPVASGFKQYQSGRSYDTPSPKPVIDETDAIRTAEIVRSMNNAMAKRMLEYRYVNLMKDKSISREMRTSLPSVKVLMKAAENLYRQKRRGFGRTTVLTYSTVFEIL